MKFYCHNQHGRRKGWCTWYLVLNATVYTSEKLGECWRKDWVNSQEEWYEEWHCNTCMEDTAQGRLGCCHSEAGGDKIRTEKDHWSHTHQKTRSHLQPWLFTPNHSFTITSNFILFLFQHQFILISCIIHCHTTFILTMVFLSCVSFVPVEIDLRIEMSWILIQCEF